MQNPAILGLNCGLDIDNYIKFQLCNNLIRALLIPKIRIVK